MMLVRGDWLPIVTFDFHANTYMLNTVKKFKHVFFMNYIFRTQYSDTRYFYSYSQKHVMQTQKRCMHYNMLTKFKFPLNNGNVYFDILCYIIVKDTEQFTRLIDIIRDRYTKYELTDDLICESTTKDVSSNIKDIICDRTDNVRLDILFKRTDKDQIIVSIYMICKIFNVIRLTDMIFDITNDHGQVRFDIICNRTANSEVIVSIYMICNRGEVIRIKDIRFDRMVKDLRQISFKFIENKSVDQFLYSIHIMCNRTAK